MLSDKRGSLVWARVTAGLAGAPGPHSGDGLRVRRSPTRASGRFLHLSPTEHAFGLGKKFPSRGRAEASPFRPHKEMQTEGGRKLVFSTSIKT